MSEEKVIERVVVPEDVAFREVGGEAVILNLETEHYFTLDAVGTRMWKLLDEHGELAKVVELLLVEYEVEREVVERDLAGLVGELVGEGLLLRG
ncbi:MAG TPA: PqqD family protein [Thermoanaerobaculia bacterium]|nr:PqqD family protein [Thermoanaerobaculia bacterium]